MKISNALNGLLPSSHNYSMMSVSLSTLYDWITDYILKCQMSILVEQQDETINTIEAQATEVEKDVETG